MGTILSEDLAQLMDSGRLYALFDVRERGEFNERHIAGATSLPRSQIEFRIAALVPDRQIPLIVYDEGGDRARLAAATLADLGYEQVSVLDGGLGGWQQNGGALASGVNVPSKAFGEKVQHERNVPELTPEDLKLLKERSVELVILDVRTPEEYQRFCIPGGTNVPGGDLILWAEELKRRTDAAVVGQLRRADAQHHRRRGADAPGIDQRSRPAKRHHGLGAGGVRARAQTRTASTGAAAGKPHRCDRAGAADRVGRADPLGHGGGSGDLPDKEEPHALSDRRAHRRRVRRRPCNGIAQCSGRASGAARRRLHRRAQRADYFQSARNRHVP